MALICINGGVYCIAGKPAPTACSLGLHSYCGSQLAGDGVGEVMQLDCVACIAGKPAPTVCSLRLHNQVIQHPQSVLGGCTAIVGASLLAMVSVRSSSWAALPVSLASQLPQCVPWGCTIRSSSIHRVSLGVAKLFWEPACWRWYR